MDVDGYKIVNNYKPKRLLASDLPMIPHPFPFVGDFNCLHANWGYGANTVDGECLAGWASINSLALLYDPKILPASTLTAGAVVLTLICRLLVLARTTAYLTDVF